MCNINFCFAAVLWFRARFCVFGNKIINEYLIIVLETVPS